MTSSTDEERERILIVDNNPENIHVLMGTLSERYAILAATSGRQALTICASSHPDLILLDIVMPEMSGYDVIRQLHADEATRDIPVIFVTAKNDVEDESSGFREGAVDYITKPFHPDIVQARVATQLKLRRVMRQLQSQNVQLTEKNRRLVELEQMRDSLTSMIVHDLRSPLSGISGYLQLLLASPADTMPAKYRHYSQKAFTLLSTLLEMINSIIDINRIEEGRLELALQRFDIRQVISESVNLLGALRERNPVIIDDLGVPGPFPLDYALIKRVISNLLTNALKFSPEKGAITVRVTHDSSWCRVAIIDQGCGIPRQYHSLIFEKYKQAAVRKDGILPSSGIGLTFCKMVIEAHGGHIGLESEEGRGSTFFFTLPLDL